MPGFVFQERNKERFSEEKIVLERSFIKANINCYTGKQGDFWISIIPALNVSGYGDTETESKKSMLSNLDLFCEDLFKLKPERRIIELNKLGWHSNIFFKKKLSKSFVDENGVLQFFDNPEQVKKTTLETVGK